MGQHPLNLGLRFILEMIALFALAYWGWAQHSGWLRYILTVGLPIAFAVVWGVFAVPNDPSRSGKTVVKTRGWARLFLELGLFCCASLALYDSGFILISFGYSALVIVHYLLSIDRVRWLFKQ